MDKDLELELGLVKQELRNVKVVHTIVRGAKDQILEVSEDEGFLVGTHKSPNGEWIEWEDVLKGYVYLRKHGQATNRTADGKVNRDAFGYRGAFIMPLLAHLTTVEVIKKSPKTLRYLTEGYPPRLKRDVQSRPKRRLSVLLERDEDGFYIASVPELRGCHTQGKTLDEVIENIRDAALLCLDLERNEDDAKLEFIGVHTIEV